MKHLTVTFKIVSAGVKRWQKQVCRTAVVQIMFHSMLLYKGDKIMKRIILLSLFLIVSLVLLASCSQAAPKVIPDSSNLKNVETPEPRQVKNTLQDYEKDLILMSSINLSKINVIELGCGFYCDAYGSFPDSLDQALNDFMVIWPENAFHSGRPVKILKTMPDVANPDIQGDIYYEKVNDYEAYIHFVTLDWKSSDANDVNWVLKKRKITSDWAQFMLAPEEEKWKLFGAALKSYTPEERFNSSFERNLSQSFIEMVCVELYQNYKFDKYLGPLLVDNGFYLVDSGFSNLLSKLDANIFTFDIGTLNDGEWIYFYSDKTKNLMNECIKFNPDLDLVGGIEVSIDCFENAKIKKSYISSEKMKLEKFDSSRTITKSDII
jgi:hypothetical protein